MKKFFPFLLALLSASVSSAEPIDTLFESVPLSDTLWERVAAARSAGLCRVGRGDLRLLRLTHIDAEGHVRLGEMVCHRLIAADLVDIFRRLFLARYPIERMRLIDDYGDDDELSMADNNTSCFCPRRVRGQRRLSRHAMGMAVDVNPLYNPQIKRGRVSPAAAKPYSDRSRRSPYKIKRGDLCWRLFTSYGFRWGGSWRSSKDYQHFEK